MTNPNPRSEVAKTSFSDFIYTQPSDYVPGNIDWILRSADNYYTPLLDKYLEANENEFQPETAEQLIEIASYYAGFNFGPHQHLDDSSVGIMCARLMALIKHPAFISSAVAIPVMESLANLPGSEPWYFEMYSRYVDQFGNPFDVNRLGNTNYKIHSEIRPGFGLEQVQGFARLINSERLWGGSSREMKRIFFSSVAEALKHLAKEYPDETYEPRIALLARELPSEVEQPLVFSFESEGERQRLMETMAQNLNTLLAKRCEGILNGRYKGVAYT